MKKTAAATASEVITMLSTTFPSIMQKAALICSVCKKPTPHPVLKNRAVCIQPQCLAEYSMKELLEFYVADAQYFAYIFSQIENIRGFVTLLLNPAAAPEAALTAFFQQEPHRKNLLQLACHEGNYFLLLAFRYAPQYSKLVPVLQAQGAEINMALTPQSLPVLHSLITDYDHIYSQDKKTVVLQDLKIRAALKAGADCKKEFDGVNAFFRALPLTLMKQATGWEGLLNTLLEKNVFYFFHFLYWDQLQKLRDMGFHEKLIQFLNEKIIRASFPSFTEPQLAHAKKDPRFSILLWMPRAFYEAVQDLPPAIEAPLTVEAIKTKDAIAVRKLINKSNIHQPIQISLARLNTFEQGPAISIGGGPGIHIQRYDSHLKTLEQWGVKSLPATPLCLALCSSSKEIVDYLLQLGGTCTIFYNRVSLNLVLLLADPDYDDKVYKTYLQAFLKEHPQIQFKPDIPLEAFPSYKLQMLSELYIVAIRRSPMSIEVISAPSNHSNPLRVLLDLHRPDLQMMSQIMQQTSKIKGYHLLFEAIIEERLEALEILLDYGFDPNTPIADGRLPLGLISLACERLHRKVESQPLYDRVVEAFAAALPEESNQIIEMQSRQAPTFIAYVRKHSQIISRLRSATRHITRSRRAIIERLLVRTESLAHRLSQRTLSSASLLSDLSPAANASTMALSEASPSRPVTPPNSAGSPNIPILARSPTPPPMDFPSGTAWQAELQAVQASAAVIADLASPASPSLATPSIANSAASSASQTHSSPPSPALIWEIPTGPVSFTPFEPNPHQIYQLLNPRHGEEQEKTRDYFMLAPRLATHMSEETIEQIIYFYVVGAENKQGFVLIPEQMKRDICNKFSSVKPQHFSPYKIKFLTEENRDLRLFGAFFIDITQQYRLHVYHLAVDHKDKQIKRF